MIVSAIADLCEPQPDGPTAVKLGNCSAAGLAFTWSANLGSFDDPNARDPLLTLPDHDAVRDYLVARRVPRPEAAEAARRLRTPLPVTKRGSLVVARRAFND